MFFITISNTLRILEENLSNIDKQILIFNMTIYNESDKILLELDNGQQYELEKINIIKESSTVVLLSLK